MFRFIFVFYSLLFVSLFAQAQNAPFDIQLTPISIKGVGGLQSFAFGQHEGKWLVVGGRLDGLHRRQPFASFDIAGHNTQIIVVDPENNQSWTASKCFAFDNKRATPVLQIWNFIRKEICCTLLEDMDTALHQQIISLTPILL
ncbi:MAG: hypothetical protein IPN46_06900 [Saprospiraceae bacterium]|nr:hypothetical protein [Saprospiraceae bacterium]